MIINTIINENNFFIISFLLFYLFVDVILKIEERWNTCKPAIIDEIEYIPNSNKSFTILVDFKFYRLTSFFDLGTIELNFIIVIPKPKFKRNQSKQSPSLIILSLIAIVAIVAATTAITTHVLIVIPNSDIESLDFNFIVISRKCKQHSQYGITSIIFIKLSSRLITSVY